MQLIFLLGSSFFMLCLVDGATLNKTKISNIVTESSTATWPVPLKKSLIREEKPNKFRNCHDIDTDHVEEKSHNDYGFEFIPVSLQHPWFKVFGINPDEYVVFYKYYHDQEQQILSEVKLNKVNLPENKEEIYKANKKWVSSKMIRPYRHIGKLDDYDFNSEELNESPVEVIPVQSKVSSNKTK